MKRSFLLALTVVVVLVAAGCSDDDDGDDAATTTVATGDAPEETAPPPSSIDPEDLEVEVFGEGTVTVTLDDGEVFEGAAACVLEEVVEGGLSVLFSAISTNGGSISVIQYGSEGSPDLADQGVVTISDPETFETQWTTAESWSLSLDGTTITGSGALVDQKSESVEATVEALC